MPTENSLSPPPKYPTGPAYIPLSNDSEKRRRRIWIKYQYIGKTYHNPLSVSIYVSAKII